jgi:threonine dehydratase
MNLPQLSDIKEAKRLVSKHLHATPILQSSSLDELLGSTNYLKAEIFQKTGSFKPRGALNKILHLSDQEKAKGMIAVSAGNHAQAVAWAATKAGVTSTVVMPLTASNVKVSATRGYGAEVILFGNSTIEAFAEMQRLQIERDLTLVHPFDDFHVIAGAGTIALEILEQVDHLDNIFVPIGGGGLISGIAIAIKALSPSTKVIGIEPDGANAMYQSLQKKQIVKLDSIHTIADGLAAPFAGILTYATASEFVDQIICVSDDEIKVAMKFLLQRCKLVVEPSGATALAALMSGRYKTSAAAKNMIILSGGNVDLQLLAAL